jgi:hypothetical protein
MVGGTLFWQLVGGLVVALTLLVGAAVAAWAVYAWRGR